MAKLYFKYGAMGSSKTAQALITKYNYEENDMSVWLIKPSADVRDGVTTLRSRIGLQAEVTVIPPDMDIYELYKATRHGSCHVIITDECQFLTPAQIEQLRAIVDDFNVPVLCFGLRTDFLTRLFPGSQRLMELADAIQEIKPCATAAPRPPSMPGSTATATSSRKVPRWCWAATTATSPCAISATSAASVSVAPSSCTDRTDAKFKMQNAKLILHLEF